MIVSQQEFEDQLRRVQDEVKDPAHGLYGPESVTWRVSRESVIFLGAGRAALLQLAHPYVAHAIEQHSATRTDPIGRFNRTFLHVYGMIFGDLESAVGAARRVRKVHDGVHGPIDEDVGKYAKGHRYRAHDAGALLWVYATLLETSVMAFEIGVEPLTLAEKDGLCRELVRFGRLFGIPDAMLPADWPSFEAYCTRMYASDELAVGRPAREIAHFLLHGGNAAARPVMRWYAAVTAGLLPPRLREEFGLPFGRAERAVFDASIRALRRTWRHLPARMRTMPDHVEALRRLEGHPSPDRVGRAVEQMLLRFLKPPTDRS